VTEFDTQTSNEIRSVTDFFSGEGVFRWDPALTADRSVMIYSEGYEDGWFSCESSVGLVGALNLATGETADLGTGTGIELNRGGTTAVVLDSDVCLPDPAMPEFWVLTPSDRVIIIDVATTDSIAIPSTPSPEAYDSPTVVVWADFDDTDDSLLVLTGDGALRRIPVGGAGSIQDHPVIIEGFNSGLAVDIVDGELISVFLNDDGSSGLGATSLTDGAVRLLGSSADLISAGVSIDEQIVATSGSPIELAPDADVTVVPAPTEFFFGSIAW
jgi:hypothetical protein